MPELLIGADRAAVATGLAHRLQEAGVDVAMQGRTAFARALAAGNDTDVTSLYWTARITLLNHHEQIEVFDEVFRSVFVDAVLKVDPHARRVGSDPVPRANSHPPHRVDPGTGQAGDGLPWRTLPRSLTADHRPAHGISLPQRLPSNLRSLADTEFDALSEADLDLVGSWLRARAHRWPRRTSRRRRAAHRGRQIDLRRTLATAHRTSGQPITLIRTAPLLRPRPIVTVCDVSQSMQPYVTPLLHLMRSVTRLRRAEVFAFSTELTRLTATLHRLSPAAAVQRANQEVADRFGGTRIAGCLRDLLSSPHGNSLRGGIVLIASDGWDTDPPEELAAVMQRLARRAHRVLWLNPRAAAPGFAPEVGSMKAALPHCDHLLPAADLHSLLDVFDLIATLR